MSMKDTSHDFGTVSIVNHWMLAILMIGMLAFGLIIEDMPRGADKKELMALHKSIGILVLFLGIWRIVWRVWQRFPKPVTELARWELACSKFIHWTLLAGILIMPLSGYIMSEAGGRSVSFFGLFTMPDIANNKTLKDIGHTIHGSFATIIMIVILFHIAAALKHHFIGKDTTLKRMLGRS